MTEKPVKINVFLSYSQQDEKLKDQLVHHLSILKRQGYIDVWHDGQIIAGEKWDDKIKSELERSDIVLLLISKDFLASRYINENEMKWVLELHRKGKIDVVPIILGECDWKSEESIASFQVLPERGKPIVSKHWYSKDEAFTNVVQGLKKVIKVRRELKEVKEFEEIGEGKIEINRVGKIQFPGGPLNPDVVNYVKRAADKQLDALLDSTYAPMFLIVGSIQCGKTSLVNRFLDKAEKEEKNRIIHIDFNKLLSANKKPGIKEVFVYIIETIYAAFGTSQKNDPILKVEEDEATLLYWAADKLKKILEKHLKDDKNVFLVIDSIDLLRWYMESWESVGSIIDWLGMLRNKQGAHPFKRLTIIAVITILSYSATFMSPLMTQAANITLPNFGKFEILELMKTMGMDTRDKEEKAEEIFNLFGGHPHLSHLAVYDLYSGIDFSDILQNAFNLSGGYGYYWKRVKRYLTFMLNQKEYENKTNLVYKALISKNKNRIESKVFKDLFYGLYLLGLVEMNQQEPCKFIKNAIKKELEQNETV